MRPGDAGYWQAYLDSLAPGAGTTAGPAPEAAGPAAGGRPPTASLAAEVAALAAGHGAAAAIEPRLRELAGRPAAGHDLVAGAGSLGQALALCRAAADGRPFLGVAELGDLDLRRAWRDGARSVYIVAESPRVEAADRLVQQAHACRDEAGWPLPVGFLSAADFETMTSLDARQRRGPAAGTARPDLIVDATDALPAADGGQLQVLPYRDVTAAGLHRRELSLLALTVHGMSDLLHLGDDYVCGKSASASAASGVPALPSCMTGGGCFHKPGGQPVRAAELGADHLFVNSCGSLRFGDSDFGDKFAVWYTALEGGALSYCGALRWKEGSGIEALLYQRLLRAGYSLGEACAVLNAALPSLGAEIDPAYALLGDPACRPHPAAARPARQRLTAGLGSVGLTGGYAEAAVDEPGCAAAARRGALSVHGHGGSPTLTAYAPTAAGVTVFVLSAEDRSETAPVEITDLTSHQAYYQDVASALAQCLDPGLGLGGLYPEKAKGPIRRDLESRVLTAARLDHERFENPAATRKLLRSLDRLRARVDDLDAETATWLAGRLRSTTYRFAEQYAATSVLAAAGPGGPCPYCGCPVHLRRVRQAARPLVTRTEAICGRCGGLLDTPDDELSCMIVLDPVAVAGTAAEVEVTITNTGPLPRDGYCAYGLRKTAALDIEHGETVQRFSAGPGAKAQLSFSFRAAAGTPAHQFDLQVAAVCTGRLYLARRSVWLAS